MAPTSGVGEKTDCREVKAKKERKNRHTSPLACLRSDGVNKSGVPPRALSVMRYAETSSSVTLPTPTSVVMLVPLVSSLHLLSLAQAGVWPVLVSSGTSCHLLRKPFFLQIVQNSSVSDTSWQSVNHPASAQ